MNKSNVIPIFFTIDENYIPFLAVTMESIIENSNKSNKYEIKVLYTNIEKESKKKIKKLEKEKISIDFIDLNYYVDAISEKLYTRDYYSKSTYFRLFLPNLFPEYDKIIYLDSDVVVLDDIAKLYNIDIGDNLIGAVPDEIVEFTPVFKEYVERVVGVKSYKKYFNAGVLIMNLKELRTFNFQEKFLYLLEKVTYTVAQDQDYLNRMCKGRVYYISQVWNKMPILRKSIENKDIKLVHYNFAYKPWHYETVVYDEYFWKYAEKTEFIDKIRKTQKEYSPMDMAQDDLKQKKLLELTELEIQCVGNDKYKKINNFTKNIVEKRKSNDLIKQSEDRLAILEEISKLEREGKFDVDPEKDPPTTPITPGEVDYLNEKLTNKLKTKVANTIGLGFLIELLRKNQLIIKNITGIENLNNVKSGAIITCNHFNPFDVFAVETVFRQSTHKRKALYKVIREGNYTSFPGFYGYLFRNSNTLPLATSTRAMTEFMKAVDSLLQDKNFILVYPEQSLWWNYKKPKPLKPGAYRFAARNNVPVIPIFITMKNSDIIGTDGFAKLEYYIHIEKPIYPDTSSNEKDAAKNMMDKNYLVWKDVYEHFYNKKLEYTTNEKAKKRLNIE